MANIHVLDRSGSLFRLAYHFAIPAANNSSGVAWATALINSGIGGKTILPDGDGTKGTISSTEKSSIVAGTIYEDVVILDVTQNGVNTTAAQMTNYVNAHYTDRQSKLLAELQGRLQWFGGTI